MKRLFLLFLICGALAAGATPTNVQQYRVRLHAKSGVAPIADAVGARIVRGSGQEAVLELTEEGAAALQTNAGVASIEACPGVCVTAMSAAVEMQTWTTGTYEYDGAGNIWAIGADRYEYDAVNRLTSGTVTKAGPSVQQSFTYDPFGNILTVNNLPTEPNVNSATNRRSDWQYDARGNATDTGYDGYIYSYDALNMQTGIASGGAAFRSFVYTADDERIAIIESTKATTW